MGRTVMVAIAFLIALGLAAEPAGADLLTPTDFDTIVLGTQVAPAVVTNFMTADLTGQGGSAAHTTGTLAGSVWLHEGVYTYKLVVDPSLGHPSQFSTPYAPGSTPATGWSYSDAVSAGVQGPPSAAFWPVGYDADGRLDWYVQLPQLFAGFWSGIHSSAVTFFLQSPLAPGFGRYDLTAAELGSAMNYAPAAPVPAPEPSTLVLLGSATTIIGSLLARRARRRTEDHGTVAG